MAVVFGLVNGVFVGSLRSKDPAINPYEFLDGALSERMGFPVDCGGRTFAGGFQVDPAKVPNSTKETLKEAIVEALLDGWSRRRPRRRSGARLRR